MGLRLVRNVWVTTSRPEVDAHAQEILAEVQAKYNLETVKDAPIFRAYRDFFWRVGIDPTKVRPASEALTRRLLGGKPLPRVNSLVDAYNLASVRSGVALAAFDVDRLRGSLTMRFARRGERFLGIGMTAPVDLGGNEVVIGDQEHLIAIYPYRDAEDSKVTEATRNVLLLTCGVPGVADALLDEAGRLAVQLVTEFCGGTPS